MTNLFFKKICLTELTTEQLEKVWEVNEALREDVKERFKERNRLEIADIEHYMRGAIIVAEVSEGTFKIIKSFTDDTILEYFIGLAKCLGHEVSDLFGGLDEDDIRSMEALLPLSGNGIIMSEVIEDAISYAVELALQELNEVIKELGNMHNSGGCLSDYFFDHYITDSAHIIYESKDDEPFILEDQDGKSDYVLYGKLK